MDDDELTASGIKGSKKQSTPTHERFA